MRERRLARRKSLGEVMDDLGRLKEQGVSGLYIVNSAFNNSYKFASDLCDSMIKARLGLKWVCCANLKCVDRQLLDKMKAAVVADAVCGDLVATSDKDDTAEELLQQALEGRKIGKDQCGIIE